MGVRIESIDIIDEERILTWENNQAVFVQNGVTKEQYDDAISRGHKFRSRGTHERVVCRDGQVGARITLFRGHDTGTLYHEFGHALHVQGKINAPAGSDPEAVANYVAPLFSKGREQEIGRTSRELTPEDLWGVPPHQIELPATASGFRPGFAGLNAAEGTHGAFIPPVVAATDEGASKGPPKVEF